MALASLLAFSLVISCQGGIDDVALAEKAMTDVIFEVHPSLAIPDNDPTGATVVLEVDTDSVIVDLTVEVDIEHTYVGDLTVILRRNGQNVTLQRRQGGSADNLLQSFSVYQFDGQTIRGTWELLVIDEAGQDTGTIHRFALHAILGDGNIEGEIFEVRPYVPIPDHDPEGATAVLEVDADGNIEDLAVAVDIEHSYVGDLILILRRDGQEVTLQSRLGGRADDLLQSYSVDDFDGQTIRGTWELHVIDEARRDTGTIRSFALHAILDDGNIEGEIFEVHPSLAIPDDDPAGVIAVLEVDDDGNIEDLAVAVDIEHTYVGDLTLILRRNGQEVTLQSRQGGSADDLLQSYSVDDFDGQTIRGTWELLVIDEAGWDIGTIRSFALHAILGDGDCIPQCSGMACGDSDGCDGVCQGTCGENATCTGSAGDYSCSCLPEFEPSVHSDDCYGMDLLNNGSFDASLSGWEIVELGCQASWDPAPLNPDSGWAQFNCDYDSIALTWGFSRLWQCVPVTAGGTYYLESKIRGTTTATLNSTTIPNLLNGMGVAFFDDATCNGGDTDEAIMEIEEYADSNTAWKYWGGRFFHETLSEIAAPSTATHALVYVETASDDLATASAGLWSYVEFSRVR